MILLLKEKYMKKILLILVLISFTLMFNSCKGNAIQKNGLSKLEKIENISDKKYSFLFFSKKGCPWCIKQKEDFKVEKYTKKYNEIDFYYIEKGDSSYNEFKNIKELNYDTVPTMFLIEKKDNQIIVFEKFSGYTEPELLHTYFDMMINED